MSGKHSFTTQTHTHPTKRTFLHTGRHRYTDTQNSETRPHSAGQVCPTLSGLFSEIPKLGHIVRDRPVPCYLAWFRIFRTLATQYGTDLSHTMWPGFGNSKAGHIVRDRSVPYCVAWFRMVAMKTQVGTIAFQVVDFGTQEEVSFGTNDKAHKHVSHLKFLLSIGKFRP